MSGESNDVDKNVVADFVKMIPNLCNGYKAEDIFNADETGLFYRAMPDKTLANKSDSCKGGKLAKERLTVLLCASSRGEKLKPLVIGKSAKPRCFKNANIKEFPILWRSNRKAWMVMDLFSEWLTIIKRKFKLEN